VQSGQNHLLWLIVLMEGFVMISLEILAIRQFMPFVGNNVTVTSLIIGCFLLFLAYGYRQGGQVQINHWLKLRTNFLLATPLIGIGLSYPALYIYFNHFLILQQLPMLGMVALYLLLVLAPLVYLLGQTLPITMNLIQLVGPTGAIGGRILHISTLGSFCGAVLTSMLLFTYLGVAWTLYLNFLILVLLIVFISYTQQQLWTWPILMLALLSGVVYQFNIAFERNFFVKTNSYANYALAKVDQFAAPGKALIINDSYSSFLSETNQAFPYIEKIKSWLFDELKLTHQQILVLGAGGFSLTAQGTYNNHFTYVDIDPDLAKVVAKHFLSPLPPNIITQDARQFLNQTPKTYDVIIGDTYSNRFQVPSHLLTQEYFQAIQQHLKIGGYAIFNLILNPTLNSAYDQRLDYTLRSVFPHCMSLPLRYTNHPTNVLYLCHHQGSTHQDRTIYRDNQHSIELDLPVHH